MRHGEPRKLPRKLSMKLKESRGREAGRQRAQESLDVGSRNKSWEMDSQGVEAVNLELRALERTSTTCFRWLSDKESTCQCRRFGFDPWVGKIPQRRKWQPTPVSLPGESHGQRSLAGYSPWCTKSWTRLSD